jgi:hypothetical protein
VTLQTSTVHASLSPQSVSNAQQSATAANTHVPVETVQLSVVHCGR